MSGPRSAEISEAPSKANAGLIGPLSVLDISPDLRKVVEGLKPGEEISVSIEEGKTLFIKLINVGSPDKDGYRIVTFELNGMAREASVLDKSIQTKPKARLKADLALWRLHHARRRQQPGLAADAPGELRATVGSALGPGAGLEESPSPRLRSCKGSALKIVLSYLKTQPKAPSTENKLLWDPGNARSSPTPGRRSSCYRVLAVEAPVD